MAGKTIHAAGGIVVRKGARSLIAVVQRSKDDRWVLPRGKLKRDENPVIGARREVVEETGHRVRVGEFLGAITYRARGRPKVVQFWLMQAEAEPSHEVMADIVAVEWLPMKAAARRLSYPLEKLFLRSVGGRAIPRRKRRKAARKSTSKKMSKRAAKKTKKTKKPKPAHSRTHKTGSHGAKTKSRARKLAAIRKSAPRKTAAAKHGAPRPAARKHTLLELAARKQDVPKRAAIVPMPVSPSAPERVLMPVAAKPASAAERKTILQRMLGRLAG